MNLRLILLPGQNRGIIHAQKGNPLIILEHAPAIALPISRPGQAFQSLPHISPGLIPFAGSPTVNSPVFVPGPFPLSASFFSPAFLSAFVASAAFVVFAASAVSASFVAFAASAAFPSSSVCSFPGSLTKEGGWLPSSSDEIALKKTLPGQVLQKAPEGVRICVCARICT